MKINKVFIKGINWVLASILGLSGFTSCEYGAPYTDYTLKGKVVNKATGQPITGIRVGYSPEKEVGLYESKAHVTTNLRGEFKVTDTFYLIDGKRVVYVEDIDGEENGLFESESLQVDFSKAERTKKSTRGYDGEYTLTVQVELNER